MGTKIRNNTIDLFRLYISFLVVYAHCGCSFSSVYRYAIPLLFTISGYFFCNIANEKKIARIKKTFFLCLSTNIAYAVFYFVLAISEGQALSWISSTFSVRSLVELVVFNKSPFAIHLWFLWALLYCMIIDYFVSKHISSKKIYVGIIIALIAVDAVYILFFRDHSKLLTRNFLFFGLPYFYIGKIFIDVDISKIKINNIGILSLFAVFIFTIFLEQKRMIALGETGELELYLSTPFLVILVFIFALKNPLEKLNKPLSTLAMCGRSYCLSIYIVHYAIISIVLKILGYNEFISTYPFLCAIFIFAIALLSSILYYSVKRAVVSRMKLKKSKNN